MRPILLDLYCGAGGASAGYAAAGFDVLGVDLAPQPNYPYPFVQGDALQLAQMLGRAVHAIHASPPCQRYSQLTKLHGSQRISSHPDLVAPTRELLRELGRPYVIENVAGAPLLDPITLCGSMFGLGAGELYLQRHRLFESSVSLWPPAMCSHGRQAVGVYGHPGGSSQRDGIRMANTAQWREAMGISWMATAELAEAIPPAYTQHIGQQLMAQL